MARGLSIAELWGYMPGIGGFAWRGDGPPSGAGTTLAHLTKRLTAAAAVPRGEWIGDACAMTAVGVSGDDGVAAGGNVTLAVTGEIADLDRYWRDVSDEPKRPPAAEVLLKRYLQLGPAGVQQLNGMYAAAVWDGRTQALHLLTDRAAFRKFCYWDAGDAVYFSTRYGAFSSLPHFPKTLDSAGVYEFCRFSYMLGQRTFFEHAKLIAPGTMLTWRDGRLTSERYWDYTFHAEIHDVGDAAAALADAVRQAVASRADGKIYLQMTGGLDSRAIAGFLKETAPHKHAEALTIGVPESLELAYAARLAQDLGYKHTAFHLDAASHAKNAEEAVRRTEGLVLNHTGWRVMPDAWVAEKGFDTATNGFFANAARSGGLAHSMDQNLSRDESLRIAYLLLRDLRDEWPLDKVVRPEVFRDVAAEPDDYLRAMAADAPEEAAVRLHDYIDFHCRQRGFLGMNLEYFRPRTRILAPLTDNGFVDTALRLGPAARKGSAAYERMIRDFLPLACKAPYIRTHLPLRAGPVEMTWRKAWGRMSYQVLPALTRGRYKPPNRAAYVPYKASLTQGSKAFFQDALRHLDGFDGILDVAYLRGLMTEYTDNKRPGYGPAYIINTLCLWHKLFVEEGSCGK